MLKPEDFMEPACPFEKAPRPYVACPERPIDIAAVIAEYDALLAREDWENAGLCLLRWRDEAESRGDKRALLTICSEMMGHFRQSGIREHSLWAVERAKELMQELRPGHTASAGTILINAATALCAFGEVERAIPLFREASRCYSESIDPNDLRFASLYNNFAAALAENGDTDGALRHYRLALSVLERNGETMDMAVTFLNMAGLINRVSPESEEIASLVEQAEQCIELPYGGSPYYRGYTARKCAKAADELGWFMLAMKLNGIADEYYEWT